MRYVTNYLKLLTDYGETLNSLFKDNDEANVDGDDQNSASLSPDSSPTKMDEEDRISFSAMARFFESVLLPEGKLVLLISLNVPRVLYFEVQ